MGQQKDDQPNPAAAPDGEVRRRQQATEELLKERNLLRVLVDNIPDCLFVKDDRSRFLINNRSHLTVLGAEDQAEVVGKTDFEIFPHEMASRYFADEQLVLQTGNSIVDREEPAQTPDKRTMWLSTTKTPVRGDDGRIVGLAGISRNITQRKQTEEALEHERNLLRTLIDNMPDYIFVKDSESRFLINNKAHLRALGVGAQKEVMGKTDFDVFPQHLASRYSFDEQLVLKTGTPVIDMEEPATDPYGGDLWLSTTKVPFRDRSGRIIGLVGISRDITERKRHEEALRKANDALEARVAERTEDLRVANRRLAARLSQLNFLTETSYELAQYVLVDQLGSAIVRAFRARFDQAEVGLCLRTQREMRFVAGTPALDTDNGKTASQLALESFVGADLQQPFLYNTWFEQDYLKQLPWPSLNDYPCYTAVPLLADNHTIGIVQVFTTTDFASRYDQELPVLTTLAAHAGTCLSNAVRYRELEEQARVQGELNAARSILDHFAPSKKLCIPRVRLGSLYDPAYEVGGDYLDYFQAETGKWILAIADVCGKGVPAALFMVMLRSAFRSEARTARSARDLLCAVNTSMMPNLDDRSFVTAICLVVEPDGQSMTYARAGHPSMVRIEAGGSTVESVDSNGLALGLVPDLELFSSTIDEVEIPLEKDSRFLIYTDGLTEMINPAQSPYGTDRLFGVLSRCSASEPQQMIDTIISDIKDFSQNSPAQDDLTIMAMHVTG